MDGPFLEKKPGLGPGSTGSSQGHTLTRTMLFGNLILKIRTNDNNLFTDTARKKSRGRCAARASRLAQAPCPDDLGTATGIRTTIPQRARPSFMTILNERRRSVAFIENDGQSWACFLVTYVEAGGLWHGYFSFRPGHGDAEEDEVRTANIFIEDSEAEVHHKARGLGRPLLTGLLDSALHTSRRNGNGSPPLRGQFRTLLKENSQEIAGDWAGDDVCLPKREELEELRSLYTSYRLDQVSHFICLVELGDFEHAVDEILDGKSIDFRSKDRVQFAMMVVDYIEGLLPLPDFETWAQDFVAHPEVYRLYTHTLHREGRLP